MLDGVTDEVDKLRQGSAESRGMAGSGQQVPHFAA
jgi:hypothetical protein